MKTLPFSSGDLVADRRADYAEMLLESGDATAAADLLRDALLLAPAWTAGWFRLGEMREAAGDLAAAGEAWTEALRLDPSDRLGASLKLALIGAAQGIDAAPGAFVETLFDQYADRFETALVSRLGYCVPELIMAALGEAGATAFAHVVDLGCGTGLMGERLRGATSFLEGCDISRGMLRKADAKRVYDRLAREDLQALVPSPRRADLVVAADVLIYLGRLERIIAAAAGIALPGALFALSVELHGGPEPMTLRPSRRYAHSEGYLRDCLARAGFAPVSLRRATLRRDRGEPIEGLIVLARLAAAMPLADAATASTQFEVDQAAAG